MDENKAKQILKVYGKPAVKVGNKQIVFARQNQEDIEVIEKLDTEELINQWKSLVFMNDIYGQVSLNEMQRISLLELEMEERNVESKPLKKWYKETKTNFDIEEFNKNLEVK